MASMVLLNEDGTVFRKLQRISLPDNYKAPEGKLISWRIVVSKSLPRYLSDKRPSHSYFYLGTACGQVDLHNREVLDRKGFGSDSIFDLIKETWVVTVQNENPSGVTKLRDLILVRVNSRSTWKVSNNMNSLFKRIWKFFTS